MTRRRARLAAAGACALAAVVLGGCRATATVAIRVGRDGRGTVAVAVRLDRDARRALASAAVPASANATPDVPLDDLRARGWTVSSWRPDSDGGASIALSKGFVGGTGLASVLAELDGRDGALRDVRVVRSRTLLRDRDSVTLLADLRHLDAGVATDAALAARLRASGVDVAELDAGLRARIGSSFTLSVDVELPDGTHDAVHVKPGARATLAVGSTATHTGRRLALVAAAVAGFLGLVLFVVSRRRPYRG
ncbi:MAG TPA: hypothetical protein VIK61_15770 [Acidimicrobiia bacterium]